MRQQLEDPRWSDAAELCIGCGYSLTGLAAPGRCPECGTEFGKSQFILTGVPMSNSGAPKGRRLAWVGIITLWVLLSFFWAVLLMLGRLLLVVSLIVGVCGLVWPLVTSPRERRGVERFVIAPVGVARIPLAMDKTQNQMDKILVPWSSVARFELLRISGFWYRLKLYPRGELKPVFDAGFRCSDAQADSVRSVLNQHLAAATSAGVPLPISPDQPTPESESPSNPSAEAPGSIRLS